MDDFKINLQLFAGEDDADDSGIDEMNTEDFEEETPEDSETDDESGEDVDSQDEAPEDKHDIRKPELNDDVSWVKKRLARAEKSYERNFLAEVNSMSEGVQINRSELPQAARLWNMLKHNPELSGAVNQIITAQLTEGKAKHLSNFKSAQAESTYESKLELRESKLDLRASDPMFRKHEQEILDWAEDEGLPVESPKDLRRVYREWKGENARRLMAEAETRGQKKALEQKQQKQDARLEGRRSPVRAPQIDYRKASAKDILKSERLSLFTNDD